MAGVSHSACEEEGSKAAAAATPSPSHAPWWTAIDTVVCSGGGAKVAAAAAAALTLRDQCGWDIGAGSSGVRRFVGVSAGATLAALWCMGVPALQILHVISSLQPARLVRPDVWTAWVSWQAGTLGLDDGTTMEATLRRLLAEHLGITTPAAQNALTLAQFCAACSGGGGRVPAASASSQLTSSSTPGTGASAHSTHTWLASSSTYGAGGDDSWCVSAAAGGVVVVVPDTTSSPGSSSSTAGSHGCVVPSWGRELHIGVTAISLAPSRSAAGHTPVPPAASSGWLPAAAVYLTPATHPHVPLLAALRASAGLPLLFVPVEWSAYVAATAAADVVATAATPAVPSVTPAAAASTTPLSPATAEQATPVASTVSPPPCPAVVPRTVCVDGGLLDNFPMHAYGEGTTLGFLLTDEPVCTTAVAELRTGARRAAPPNGDNNNSGGSVAGSGRSSSSSSSIHSSNHSVVSWHDFFSDEEDDDGTIEYTEAAVTHVGAANTVASGNASSTHVTTLQGVPRSPVEDAWGIGAKLTYLERLIMALLQTRDVLAWHALTPMQQFYTIVIPTGGCNADIVSTVMKSAVPPGTWRALHAAGRTAVLARLCPHTGALRPSTQPTPADWAEPAAVSPHSWPAFLHVTVAALRARSHLT